MNCDQCPLKGRPRTKPKGDLKAKYVLIGEAPGRQEARQGLPFVGRSGQLLRKFLAVNGIDYDECYVTNAVLCHPPDNKCPPMALECCQGRLREELSQTEGRILVMGRSARDSVLGKFKKGVLSTRGWHKWEGRDVMATVHPAYVLYNQSNAPMLLKDLKRFADGPQEPIEVRHIVIDTYDLLRSLITEVAKYEDEFVAFDLETTQVDYQRDDILCIGVGYTEGLAAIIDPAAFHPGLLQRLFDLPVRWVAHNAKFDLKFLKEQWDIDIALDADTIVMHYTLDERKGTHGLKGLADEIYDVGDYEAEGRAYITKKSDDYGKIPRPILYKYCAMDCELTRRLAVRFEEQMTTEGLYETPYHYPMMAAIPMLLEAELRGILVDWEGMTKFDTEVIGPELEKTLARIRELVGKPEFNPRSSKQAIELLYDDFKLPLTKTRSRSQGRVIGKRSSQKEVVAFWQKMIKEKSLVVEPHVEEFLELLVYYRHVIKMRSSYVNKWAKCRGTDNRVHPTFLLRGTVTGRLAAKDPPIQTLPSDPDDKWGVAMAAAHIPTPGYKFLHCDYSQCELRVAAGLSKDPFMLAAFQDPKCDYHSYVARTVYGEDFQKFQRDWCKRLTFGWLFGGNTYEIARDALMFPEDKARRFATEWADKFKVMVEWRKAASAEILKRGYCESLLGRRRRFPFLTKDNKGDAQRAAMNMPIQSMASDMTLISAIRLYDRYKADDFAHVVLLIHDAIVMEVLEARVSEVAGIMEATMVGVATEFFPEVLFVADVHVLDNLAPH